MTNRKRTKEQTQQSTNTSHNTKDRATRTPLKIRGEPRCYSR